MGNKLEKIVGHKERAHSKFSASGSERWLKCPASVELQEKSPPSKDNFWSLEGTYAHEVLELMLTRKPLPKDFKPEGKDREMHGHLVRVRNKVFAIHKAFGGTLLVEKKIYAMHIHEEMFGTCDIILLDDQGTLHIMDFKYGANHIVSPKQNTQLIQYALSAAEAYFWDFDNVKMWILQPRAGENWAPSWTITKKELHDYWLPLWHKGVARVEKAGAKTFPGAHCHWCTAWAICPSKKETRNEKYSDIFNNTPIGESRNGIKKENGKKSHKKEKQKSDYQKEKESGEEDADFL